MIRHRLVRAFLAISLLSGCAASLDRNPSERCSPTGTCSEGRACERGFCLLWTNEDAGADTGVDPGLDAGFDTDLDAGSDAGQDASLDAGSDAGQHAGSDASIDSSVDSGADAAPDDAGTGADLPPPACWGDATRCGLLCVWLQNDSDFCGSCDIACAVDDRCRHGNCEPR